MHPHVAQTILGQGFDICVYNYTSSLGATPTHRHVFASHVASGSFDGLVEEMSGVVEDLRATYKTIVVYAHSTGATILTNYLLKTHQNTHTIFSGIYLNSPFFEWGRLDTCDKKILRGTPHLLDTLKLSADLVLQQGNAFDSGRARIHTQHEYDVRRYQSYQTVHMTLGFAAAVQRVFDTLDTKHHKSELVTTVPVCLLTTLDDDTLDATETIERTSWFGPHDSMVPPLILDYGSHDVFLSPLVGEVQNALDHIRQFLYTRRI
jgi:alpha-beta hydrolase superfamily lysophospholipase